MSALSIFVQWIALILVLVPAFLADAPPQPILAALLGVTGGLMLAVPPSIPLPRKIGWASLVFFVTSAMAFLPDNWFQEPAWRKTFRSTGEIALSRCSTLQPWHTGWGLILIGAGLLFGLFLLCNPVNRENHFRLATFFTIGIGIYAGVSILAVETGWKHPWAIIGSFGFLPNRNHVGTLLVMGGVAGLGPLNQAISKKRWGFLILLLIALGGIFTAITVYNVSRAAVPLLMGGCLLWVAGVLGRPLSLKQATFSVGLLGIACYFFIHSNAPSSQRLGLLISGKSENSSSIQTSTLALDSVAPNDFSDIVPFDFRWLIYKDTLDLIADHPVQGVGLGNYRYLIPQYRKASLSENTMLHSDSSVLLIAAETGIPALISVVVLLTLCWLRLKGCAAHHSWNVRWSSAVAFLVFLIHSTFDIPAHRTATLLPALFIAGLAFRPPSIERINEEGLRLSRFIFSGFGLALLVTAGWLVNWIPIGLNAPLILPVE